MDDHLATIDMGQSGGIDMPLSMRGAVEFLLSVNELLFLSLMVEALQGKMCQNSLPSGGGASVSAKISGGRGRRPATCQYCKNDST